MFVAGKFKFASYGLVMLMNVITLLVSYSKILAPYEGSTNHLFVASIVVAAKQNTCSALCYVCVVYRPDCRSHRSRDLILTKFLPTQ